jgi:hypothetical protein
MGDAPCQPVPAMAHAPSPRFHSPQLRSNLAMADQTPTTFRKSIGGRVPSALVEGTGKKPSCFNKLPGAPTDTHSIPKVCRGGPHTCQRANQVRKRAAAQCAIEICRTGFLEASTNCLSATNRNRQRRLSHRGAPAPGHGGANEAFPSLLAAGARRGAPSGGVARLAVTVSAHGRPLPASISPADVGGRWARCCTLSIVPATPPSETRSSAGCPRRRPVDPCPLAAPGPECCMPRYLNVTAHLGKAEACIILFTNEHLMTPGSLSPFFFWIRQRVLEIATAPSSQATGCSSPSCHGDQQSETVSSELVLAPVVVIGE